MVTAQEVLDGVRWEYPEDEELIVKRAELNHALDFVTVGNINDPPNDSLLLVIGFGVPGWQQGTGELPDEVRSITELHDLKPEMQDPKLVLKGVGLRFYNTPQALGGTRENYSLVGAYALFIDPLRIYDGRRFATTYHLLAWCFDIFVRDSSAKG